MNEGHFGAIASFVEYLPPSLRAALKRWISEQYDDAGELQPGAQPVNGPPITIIVPQDEYKGTLWESLTHISDLYAVLRAHLFIDATLDELLLLKMPDSRPLLQRTNFRLKVQIARELQLFDKGTAKAIYAVNEIRNRFAHDLNKEQLSAEDDEMLVRSMNDAMRHTFDRAQQPLSTSTVGPGKLAIASLYVHLRHMRMVAKGQLTYPFPWVNSDAE